MLHWWRMPLSVPSHCGRNAKNFHHGSTWWRVNLMCSSIDNTFQNWHEQVSKRIEYVNKSNAQDFWTYSYSKWLSGLKLVTLFGDGSLNFTNWVYVNYTGDQHDAACVSFIDININCTVPSDVMRIVHTKKRKGGYHIEMSSHFLMECLQMRNFALWLAQILSDQINYGQFQRRRVIIFAYYWVCRELCPFHQMKWCMFQRNWIFFYNLKNWHYITLPALTILNMTKFCYLQLHRSPVLYMIACFSFH